MWSYILLKNLIGKNKTSDYRVSLFSRKFQMWWWLRKSTEIKLGEFNMLSEWGFET